MWRFRSDRLRKLIVAACLTTAALAWQGSVADPFLFDSASHQHEVDQASGDRTQPEAVTHDGPAYHHCSSCAVHMLALGAASIDFSFVKNDVHRPRMSTSFKSSTEAPPVPPPNA